MHFYTNRLKLDIREMIANNLPKLKVGGSHRVAQGSRRMNLEKPPRHQNTGLTLRQLKMRITTEDPVYRGLKKIKLKGKELARLPINLFNLTELQVLDLSPEREACLFYHLTKIPTEICNLSNLMVLALDTNKLTSLPEELCSLSSLERLALSNNQLSELPESLPSLINLRSLYCSNNRFDHLPSTVCQLKCLVFMDFSDNFIIQLPGEIGAMDNLECLILCYNQLKSLPESICNLRTLQMLWLSGNCLTELPQGFEKLLHLDWSHMMLSAALDDNPLQHPPLSIAKQGPAAIDKYLSRHKSNRSKQTHKTKGKL